MRMPCPFRGGIPATAKAVSRTFKNFERVRGSKSHGIDLSEHPSCPNRPNRPTTLPPIHAEIEPSRQRHMPKCHNSRHPAPPDKFGTHHQWTWQHYLRGLQPILRYNRSRLTAFFCSLLSALPSRAIFLSSNPLITPWLRYPRSFRTLPRSSCPMHVASPSIPLSYAGRPSRTLHGAARKLMLSFKLQRQLSMCMAYPMVLVRIC